MNSKQRRTLRRYIEKNLYNLIYQDGLDRDKIGCFEYDLFPSKSKLYIDFPNKKDDGTVYVKIPNFQIVNREVGTSFRGENTIKFSTKECLLNLKNLESLTEITPFEGAPFYTVRQKTYPQFILGTDSDYVYWFFSNYNNKIVIKKKLKESDEDKYSSNNSTLEEILDDKSVSKEAKVELAFNIDLFSTMGEHPSVNY